MAMGEKELQRWRRRLQHSRNVYVRKGILGMRGEASTTRVLIDMYRGDHWGRGHVENASDPSNLKVVNKLFSILNAEMARLASRNPKVQAFPRQKSAIAAAPKAEALINYDIDEQNHVRQLNLALRDAHLAPVGAIRHGFTPEEEFEVTKGRGESARLRRLETYRPIQADRPWIREIPLWDVLLDTTCQAWHPDGGLGWCAFRDLRSEQWIKDHPKLVFRDGLGPNIENRYRQMLPPELEHDQSEDFADQIELWTVYEAHERTWFTLTIGEGVQGLIRERADWPIDWEWLPLNLLGVNEQMDSPWPVPLLEQGIVLQQELNAIRTILSFVARNTRRIIVANPQAIEDEELDKLEYAHAVEILKTKGMLPKEALEQLAQGGVPQELLVYEAAIKDDLREMFGQSLMDRGQRINVQTAREAGQVQAGSNLLAGRVQSAFETFVNDVERTYVQARRATMTEDEVVPILGAEAAAELGEQFLNVSPEHLHADLDWKLVVGSTLPEDRDREAARALNDLQSLGALEQIANVRRLAERYVDKRGLPKEVLQPEGEGREELQTASLAERGGTAADPQLITAAMGGGN